MCWLVFRSHAAGQEAIQDVGWSLEVGVSFGPFLASLGVQFDINKIIVAALWGA